MRHNPRTVVCLIVEADVPSQAPWLLKEVKRGRKNEKVKEEKKCETTVFPSVLLSHLFFLLHTPLPFFLTLFSPFSAPFFSALLPLTLLLAFSHDPLRMKWRVTTATTTVARVISVLMLPCPAPAWIAGSKIKRKGGQVEMERWRKGRRKEGQKRGEEGRKEKRLIRMQRCEQE